MASEHNHIPELSQLRTRHSSKWRRYGNDVLPMHVAEMDFEISTGIRETLKKMIDESDLGYLGPVAEVGAAFSKYAAERWHWQVDSNRVKLATDVGVAAVELFRALVKPGDRIMLNSPVYTNFWHWIPEAQAVIADVPLDRARGWRLDLEAIDHAFASGVKVLLLCNPQNPTGTVHTREELTALAASARKHGAVVISDEIHAPLTYSENKFVPFLECGEDAREVGICITSSSKSWNTAGLKAAIVVYASDAMAGVVARLPEAMHWRASLLGAFAMAESYDGSADWVDRTLEVLNDNRHHLLAELAEKLPLVKTQLPGATYLAWLDVSELNLGEHPAAKILEAAKVAVEPGTNFGPQYGQFVRFNFASSKENISEAIERISAI
jgi:cystathionine beta-lyase